MLTTNHTQNLRKASGEELLLLAILGSPKLKARIDRELDRRAMADTVAPQTMMPVMHTAFTVGVA